MTIWKLENRGNHNWLDISIWGKAASAQDGAAAAVEILDYAYSLYSARELSADERQDFNPADVIVEERKVTFLGNEYRLHLTSDN